MKKQMKTGKAVGLDYIPVEFWKYLVVRAVAFLTKIVYHNLGE